MSLEIGNFTINSIVFSDKTSYKNSILTINKEEALALITKDKRITKAEIYLVKPGDMVRIVPVKDAIEPRIRPDGASVFPGVFGNKLRVAGNNGQGRIHALKGCSVLVVGDTWGCFQDGLIDMGGEGAKYTYFSKLKNIVLVADTDEEFEQHEQQKKNLALREAGFKLAEYLAETVKNLEPEKFEIYDNTPLLKRESSINKLPAATIVMQAQSQIEIGGDGQNDLFYGWDTNHIVPTLIKPTEILDGALISGSFMPSSSKWSTYDIQNHPTIKRMLQEHGKTLNFVGVILSNLNVAMEQKERSAIIVAEMAKLLGVDCAIVNEPGYGNPDADYIACLVALEEVGIKTVGLSNEATGRDGASQPLVALDEKATAIVSTGNVSELIKLPPMPVVLGDLNSLARDGLSGGWADDEILGSSVKDDGSIIIENNAMFCGDQTAGWSKKTMKEF